MKSCPILIDVLFTLFSVFLFLVVNFWIASIARSSLIFSSAVYPIINSIQCIFILDIVIFISGNSILGFFFLYLPHLCITFIYILEHTAHSYNNSFHILIYSIICSISRSCLYWLICRHKSYFPISFHACEFLLKFCLIEYWIFLDTNILEFVCFFFFWDAVKLLGRVWSIDAFKLYYIENRTECRLQPVLTH